jgi:anthranilate synthase/aminodeoxychorismate synthase-like glutamine amidotransferase
MDLIRCFGGRVPVLGVCLGHQSIGEVFGGRVVRASAVVHGKASEILHDGKSLFRNLESPLKAGRYHSLVVERETLPACLEVSAWTKDGVIMGLRHREKKIEGVQFHPESILTPAGKKLLSNFLQL